MPLQVIGAGYGRTGTTSITEALNILGFKCYHMFEAMHNTKEQNQVWCDAADGKKVDWEIVWTDKYTATADWPAMPFWREYMELYPDAKVLLSTRDFESWYKSTTETIYAMASNPLLKFLCFLFPNWVGNTIARLVWKGIFKNRFEDKEFMRETFHNHIQEVKRVVPPSRLLVYEVKQGWEPLCKFLGVPVPSTPFPNVNDSVSFKKKVRKLRIATHFVFALLGVAIGVIAWYFLKP